MSKKLFVGSLSWNIDDRGLREAFAPHGEITEATVITDRDSGRSRGFGFVTFADDEAAERPSPPSTTAVWTGAPSRWTSPRRVIVTGIAADRAPAAGKPLRARWPPRGPGRSDRV